MADSRDNNIIINVPALMREIEAALPLYAYPTKQLVREFREANLRENMRLEIYDVQNTGMSGGITCAIALGGTLLLPSITKLRFLDDASIYHKINEYIAGRLQWEKENLTATRAPFSEPIGPNAPCPCGSGKKHKKCCFLYE